MHFFKFPARLLCIYLHPRARYDTELKISNLNASSKSYCQRPINFNNSKDFRAAIFLKRIKVAEQRYTYLFALLTLFISVIPANSYRHRTYNSGTNNCKNDDPRNVAPNYPSPCVQTKIRSE